jgi:adenosylcobyric acid synthase
MAAKTLMIQGTSSSVGKSLLVTALCRIFSRRGVRVAPFKAQNMSNNAAVCADGSEIGRAQALQAAAAGLAPVADMNPILLKPEADSRSQVIVLGRPWRTLQAGSYYRRKEELWPIVTAAFDRLRSAHDLVLIEGAGSPAELNLRSADMVNMALAAHAEAPVLLVGDIDRGGIFAQLLGTLWLLEPVERARVRGLVVNKFRGDRKLFTAGVSILEARSGLPVLGVLPFLPNMGVPEEDAVALDTSNEALPARLDIAVIRLPHIANFDDFDPLRAEPGVRLYYVDSPQTLGRPRAIILPGTKSTSADLVWLRAQGLADEIRRRAETDTAVVGICGGYQMLGRSLRDPQGVEAAVTECNGLGLLPVDTVFERAKATFQVRAVVADGPGWLDGLRGQELHGYEIHVGKTESAVPWLRLVSRNEEPCSQRDGAIGNGGRVWGCYLHGLFANDAFRHAWLRSLEDSVNHASETAATLNGNVSYHQLFEHALTRLADAVECELDLPRLEAIIEGR